MPSNPISLDSSFIPDDRLHPQGAAFLEQVTGLLDGHAKEPAAVEAALSGWDGLLETMAANLYRIGSMLVGEGEEAIGLIEQVVANIDLPASSDPADVRHKAHLLLAAGAISVLHGREASSQTPSLAAPAADSGPASCIEDDDLDAVGVSPAELEQMISGPESHRLRDWLEGLSAPLRVIFVLRAVAGLSSAEVAGLLSEHGGPEAQDSSYAWTPEAVRATFRQALCSLASQLIHATANR
jgi:hypothetical protein